MIRWNVLCLMAVTLALVTASALANAKAGEKPAAAKGKLHHGEVKSVDLTAKSFVLVVSHKNKETKEVTTEDLTIKYNDSTKFVLDGNDSTADKVLVVGKKVTARVAEDVAVGVMSGKAPTPKEGTNKDKAPMATH